MPGRLLRFWHAEAGNFATLFALLLPLLLGVAAFAVDEASLYLEKRRLQSAADLAAIHAAGDPSNALARARNALIDAGYDLPADAIDLETGHYRADAALAPAERFAPGGGYANAVRLSVSHPGRLHFANVLGIDPPTIGATATASATPRAAFSIGSRLVGLEGGLLNAILGGLLGTSLNLSVLDYTALAHLDVDLLDFLDALAGGIGLTVGTYGDLLAAEVALADIALALSSAAGGDALFLGLSGVIDDSIHVEMLRLLAVDGLAHLALGTSAALEAQVNALQLLSAAAMIADGERQVSLDLGVDIPGIAGTRVQLLVGEPPQGSWFSFGAERSYVRTAQVRLKIDISILGSGGTLGLLSIGLPVYAELAPAEAELTALSCPPGRPDLARATIAARPGVLTLAVGQISDAAFRDTRKPLDPRPAGIVSLLGGAARVTAYAAPRITQTHWIPVDFTQADVAAGTVKTVRTGTIVSSLTNSLLGDLQLDLEILGADSILIRTLLSGVLAIVRGLLAPVAVLLDHLLGSVLAVLGLGIGEADVRMHGFDCRNAALVQ